jgi:uncharacterized protein YlaI
MCERCVEIDKRLERYRVIRRAMTDETVLRILQTTIDQLEAEKLALHPRAT